MRHVLIINPNTRVDLTHQLQQQVAALLGDAGVAVHAVTAPYGADYIASEATYVVAAHAVLDAWHLHVLKHGRPAAVLVCCFGDPGVWALREQAGVPVMGLAEAAMREADALGPFAIVTGGAAWGPMLERLARGLGLFGPEHLRGVHTVAASGGELAADPVAGAVLLGQACQAALRGCTPQRPLAHIILGGAALGGWGPQVQAWSSVPLIDSVAAGARWLRTTLPA